MFGLLWLALLVAYATCRSSCLSGVCSCEVRMRTESGWVCGRVRTAELGVPYASFRGVPYGKPPLGARRFQELELVDPWDGFSDANEESPACPQKDLLYGHITQYPRGMSEDCIYLNLHVPLAAFPQFDLNRARYEVNECRGLPILVMVHGGGFHTGSGQTDLHGPEYLMTKDVIIITFNYRLNVFGFLSMGTEKIPGNQGLRDQLTLLRWVKRHARAFGGDPDNVTLMGQSAGASIAHILSLSKAAEGLFHRIILMSGTALPNYYTTSPQYAKQLADGFIEQLGINSTDTDEIHRQLTEIPIVNIMQAYNIIQHDYGVTSFLPVLEDEYPDVTRVLDDDPLELISQGRGKYYPLLMGFTNKEEEFFRWLSLNLNLVKRIQENPNIILTYNLAYKQSPEKLSQLSIKVKERYFNGTPTLDEFLVLLGDTYFKQAAIKGALWTAMAGAPTYLYQYSYKSKRSVIKEGLWSSYEGAAHVEDLTYVFKVNSMLGDCSSFPPKNEDDLMKVWMTTLITNFMKCSTPTCCEDESDWPPLSPDHLQYQSIEQPMVFHMKDATADQLDMLDFYDSIDLDFRRVTERLKNIKENIERDRKM